MQKIYFLGIKEKLIDGLKEVLLGVADWAEGKTWIGDAIAWAIRGAITASESDMTKTLEDTTTSSIETAKTKINKTATEAGGEAGTNWMSEMKQKINSDKDNLETTMKNIVTDASNNSKSTANSSGQQLGNELMSGTKDSIQLSKDSLGTTIEKTTDEATSSSLSNIEQSGKRLGIKEIDGVKLGQVSEKRALSSNLTGVVIDANSNVNTSSSNGIGSNIITGINFGISSNKTSLFTTMSKIASGLLGIVKSTLGIHSPSREMASLAKFIPLGIAEGIDSTSDKAVGSMKDLVADIEDTASNMNVQYNIPKIPRNAISYVPKQAISTNEVQRSIIGNSDILDKLLKENNTNKEYTFILPVSVDGEVFYKTIIKKKEKDLFATNGGY